MSALEQQKLGTIAGATSLAVTLDAAPKMGNVLVAFVGASNGIEVATSVASTGTVWKKLVGNTLEADCEIWIGRVVDAVPSSIVTVTFSAAQDLAMNVAEFSGSTDTTDGAAPIGTSGTSISPLTGTKATAKPDDLLLACVTTFGTNSAPSAGPTNGFRGLTNGFVGSILLMPAYQIVAARGSFSTGYTLPVLEAWNTELVAVTLVPSIPDYRRFPKPQLARAN